MSVRTFTIRVKDWRDNKSYEADVEIDIDWRQVALDIGGNAVLNKTRRSTALARRLDSGPWPGTCRRLWRTRSTDGGTAGAGRC